jgi:hypothetical protein
MHKSNTSRNDTLEGIQKFEGELMGNFIEIWKFNQQLLSTSQTMVPVMPKKGKCGKY